MPGVLATILLLSACSVFSHSEPAPPPEPEKNALRIGVGNAIETAPVRIAVEKGLFERAGLRVELVEQPTGRKALESLTNGELDAAFTDNVALFRTAAAGTRLRVQGEAYVAGPGSMAVLTLPGSASPKLSELPRLRVAVGAQNGLGTLTTRSALDTAGFDPDDISFVPRAAGDRVDALRDGDADAAWLVEPYITLAQKDHGARVLTDFTSGATEAFPLSSYVTTAGFAERNPRTVRVLRQVLRAAQRIGNEPARIRTALPRMTDLDEVTASLVSLGSYPPTVNAVRLQRVADLMQGAGILDKRIDVRSMVPEPELS